MTVVLTSSTISARAEDDAVPSVTAADYARLGLPVAEEPTAERPYHYMRFDAQTKAQYPEANPLSALILNSERLVVLNFIDEKTDEQNNPRFSQVQTQVLEQTLTALAPRSETKELMLMDIVVRDVQGNAENWSTYGVFYEENRLGPDGSTRPDALLPYGVAYGEPLNPGSGSTLFDFALMNGVKNDADLQASARSIFHLLDNTIEQYDQKN